MRIREVPEMEFCLAYVPSRAELYRLNPSAWFVLRLCESRTEREMALEYHRAMEPMLSLQEAHEEVRAALDRLMGMDIITTTTRRTRDAQEA